MTSVYGSDRTPTLIPSSGTHGSEVGMSELYTESVCPSMTGTRRESAKRAETSENPTAT